MHFIACGNLLLISCPLASPVYQNISRTTRASQITNGPLASIPASFPTTTIRSCVQDCTYQYVVYTVNSWIKYMVENVTVATAIVIVDDTTNKTTTTTRYVESLLVNGTALSNTARTNAAGTVTGVVTGYDGSATTV